MSETPCVRTILRAAWKHKVNVAFLVTSKGVRIMLTDTKVDYSKRKNNWRKSGINVTHHDIPYNPQHGLDLYAAEQLFMSALQALISLRNDRATTKPPAASAQP